MNTIIRGITVFHIRNQIEMNNKGNTAENSYLRDCLQSNVEVLSTVFLVRSIIFYSVCNVVVPCVTSTDFSLHQFRWRGLGPVCFHLNAHGLKTYESFIK